MTISCRDCDSIPKVPGAGRVIDSPNGPVQVMHNGSRVVAGGYYGQWMMDIIRGLAGHHEPQEECLFHHLLSHVEPGSTFVELGAFWAYYTNWYLAKVPRANAICVEPDANHLAVGRANLRLNRHEALLLNACVGGQACESLEICRESDAASVQIPCLDMAALFRVIGRGRIEVLHMDAQGAELSFVRSIRDDEMTRNLRFLVVSTHHESISGSATTHEDCVEEIKRLGGAILAEHSVAESFSGDGLVVASFRTSDKCIAFPPISRNRPELSLFG